MGGSWVEKAIAACRARGQHGNRALATIEDQRQRGGGDEVRSLPTATRSRRRLSWLSINIVLNIIAASVIVYYEETLAQVIALAVFLPIISDMSGCSGNQAVAVSMRELTLGAASPRDVARVWRKELSVGLINGLALGTLLSLSAAAASACCTWK